MRVLAIPLAAILVAASGCKKDEVELDVFDAESGLLGLGLTTPFPSAHLVGDDGKLALSPDQFPPAPSPFPADLANYRTGFSPVQVSTLWMPDISCKGCPEWKTATPGEGSVLLVDLTANEFLPVMAEKDAWKPKNGEDATLLVRPQVAVPYGHQVAVVVTNDAMTRPERFDRLIRGEYDTPWTEHYQAIVDQVDALGIPAETIALAWDYPVGDGTQPTRSAVAQSTPPGGLRFNFVKEADLGDATPPSIWRQGEGTFDVVAFVASDGNLDMDPDTGDVAPTGTETANIAIAIPHSVKDAPANSVPVVVYGHGLLSTASADIYARDGDWAPLELANELGMIVVATDWGGLDGNDFLVSIGVANDLGKFPNLAAHMVQGQANHQAMLDLVRDGTLGANDTLLGAQGQELIDPGRVYYWGVSMGGILGGVAMAQEGADYEAGVFHVGGSSWSSLLERSSAWTQFEMLVTLAVESPADRQLFYSASQLFWDPVDPISYVGDLQDELILLQESVNDDTVHNMTTRMYARSLGIPQLDPSAYAVPGMATEPADLPAGSSAYVQFDPGRSEPDDKNRPAFATGAHVATLGWWETTSQATEFLHPGTEGTVVHYCGAEACSSSNRGTEP